LLTQIKDGKISVNEIKSKMTQLQIDLNAETKNDGKMRVLTRWLDDLMKAKKTEG